VGGQTLEREAGGHVIHGRSRTRQVFGIYGVVSEKRRHFYVITGASQIRYMRSPLDNYESGSGWSSELSPDLLSRQVNTSPEGL
jgi:hypothetical protein